MATNVVAAALDDAASTLPMLLCPRTCCVPLHEVLHEDEINVAEGIEALASTLPSFAFCCAAADAAHGAKASFGSRRASETDSQRRNSLQSCQPAPHLSSSCLKPCLSSQVSRSAQPNPPPLTYDTAVIVFSLAHMLLRLHSSNLAYLSHPFLCAWC